ncbi:MAG: VOC family protein [Polyangiaceae bacterium]|nr:VOC family protein [Polyangiaceae bacterium]
MSDSAASVGRFVWFDLVTSRVAESADFYERLFPTWKIDAEMNGDPLRKIRVEGRAIGAIRTAETSARGPYFRGYVTVNDVATAGERIAAAGGLVVEGPSLLDGVGNFVVATDPNGAIVAAISTLEEIPEHSGPMPDGAFCWQEVLAKTPDKLAAFYVAVFGWSHTSVPTPMGPYHLFRRGERDAAGMMPMPESAGGAPVWLAYVYASDIEGTQAKLSELGGTVHRPVSQVPGIGQFAVVSDRFGAMFCLFRSERG